MYTRLSRWFIALVVMVGVLACSGQGQAPLAPLDEAKVVELSTDIHVTDVFGDDAVGFDEEGELWLMNIRTGDSRKITSDGNRKWNAVLSADHVAWIDQRRMVRLPGHASPMSSSDVFVLNRHTGEERRITEAPATRHGLHISGARLVWQDNREGLQEDRSWDFDIYAYDLGHDLEIPVAVTPGREDAPAIHGERVVWTHNPNKPPRGLAVPGSTARPDNRFNIFSYNLATEEKRPLVETGEHNVTPSSTANCWRGSVSAARTSPTSFSWTSTPGSRRSLGLAAVRSRGRRFPRAMSDGECRRPAMWEGSPGFGIFSEAGFGLGYTPLGSGRVK